MARDINYENYPHLTVWNIRVSDSAYNCRGANAVIAFEMPSDAMILESTNMGNGEPVATMVPTTLEDFQAVSAEIGTYAIFECDCYDGKLFLALPSWCCSEMNLEGLANELSCGWGTSSFVVVAV